MKNMIPENLTFEQFKALADRQPSMEGNWLYRLTQEMFLNKYTYPEFRLCRAKYLFYSHEEAVRYMREKLVGKDRRHETYRFLISQIPVGEKEYMHGAQWLYDYQGNLLDYSVTLPIRYGNYPDCTFFGRSREHVRFQKGDIVEVVSGDTVNLAIVGAEGPAVEWFWDLYLESNDYGYPYDDSDDCYFTIDVPGGHHHAPTLSLMKPRQPIPQDVKEYFEECLRRHENDEAKYDLRILDMDDSCMSDVKTSDIVLKYDSESKEHRLFIRETNFVTTKVGERETLKCLPDDFSDDEVQKIKNWLMFKKYGKTRLWYLITQWNDQKWEHEPELSPDTAADELLTK